MRIAVICRNIPNRSIFKGGIENMWLELAQRLPFEIKFFAWPLLPGNGYDLYITNGDNHPLVLISQNLFHKKRIHVYHGTYAGVKSALGKGLFWKGIFYEFLLGIGSVNVSVSIRCQLEVKQVYGYNSQIINNGVNLAKFSAMAKKKSLRKKYNIPFHKVVVLYMGGRNFKKGYDLFQKIFKKIRDASDSNKEQGYFFLDCSKLGIGYEKIEEIIQSSDICIFPSRYEGDSLALLECMACGKPFVSFKTGRLASVAGNNTEFLVEQTATNIIDFEKKIEKLLRSKDLRIKLGVKNREYAEKFSWDIVAKKYERLIKSTLEN
ncbi:glycosyltransferase family 4 protein [Candidatus Woesearchaeota archaeon]|nr:glycosyltransferase family 4 protein [Candidatus Woesearchaeota archaeon]